MADQQTHPLPASIGRPAMRALAEAGYTRLEEVAGVKAVDIARLHGVGPKAIKVLRQALAERGLGFADESPPA